MTTDTEIDISNMSMRERVVHFRLMTFQWMPYLSPYVYSLVLIERPGIGTMAVDMQGRMYYDPAFVETLTLEQGGYVVIHEAFHLILRHCHRSKDIIGPNPTPRQRARLNVAYDCVIWELLESIKDHAPKIKDGDIVTFPNLSARYPKLRRNMMPGEIYSIMLEQDEEEQKAATPPPKVEDDEDDADDPTPEPTDEEDNQTPEPADEEDFDPEFDPDIEPEDSGDDHTSDEDEADGEADADEDGEENGKPDDDDIGMPAGDTEDDTHESDEDTDGSGDTEGNPDGEEDEGTGGDGETEAGPRPKFEDLSPIDDGSCSDGQPRDYEEEPNDNWDTFIEDKLLEQVEKEVERHEQQNPGRGNVPGCLKSVIKDKLHPAPNPWDRLRAAVSLAAANPRGRPDFTYQRPNRRQFAMPDAPRLKGQTKYAPKACVIVDTSGSMTSKCLAKALVVIQQGLKALGKVPVITCDARVTKDVVLSSFKDDFELVGGGGTDMRIPIAYCEKKYKPDTIVLVTDTDTPWPDKPTKGQLIVAATRNGYVPKWATTVRIPDKENQ